VICSLQSRSCENLAIGISSAFKNALPIHGNEENEAQSSRRFPQIPFCYEESRKCMYCSMGFAGYVAVYVQLYCRCFTALHLVVTVYTTCFGLHGHLQGVGCFFFPFIFLKESTSLVLLARGYTLRVSFVFFCSVLLVIFLFLACVFVCKADSFNNIKEKNSLHT
jgi:hypothetical protein